jgi:hypothetical protein
MEMEIDWYEGREGCLRVDLVIEQAKLFTDCRRALSQCDNSVEGKIGLYGFRVDCFQLGSCTSEGRAGCAVDRDGRRAMIRV